MNLLLIENFILVEQRYLSKHNTEGTTEMCPFKGVSIQKLNYTANETPIVMPLFYHKMRPIKI